MFGKALILGGSVDRPGLGGYAVLFLFSGFSTPYKTKQIRIKQKNRICLLSFEFLLLFLFSLPLESRAAISTSQLGQSQPQLTSPLPLLTLSLTLLSLANLVRSFWRFLCIVCVCRHSLLWVIAPPCSASAVLDTSSRASRQFPAFCSLLRVPRRPASIS